MTTGFALALLAAQQAGSINVNFRGIALGDSWISPIDFVDTWGPFLRATSLMDSNQLDIMNQQAVIPCDQAVAAGQWTQATNLWGSVENYVEQYACVDFYNILDVDCNAYETVGSANSGVTIRGKSRYNLKKGMSQAALDLAPEGIDRSTLQQLHARHVSHYYGWYSIPSVDATLRRRSCTLAASGCPAVATCARVPTSVDHRPFHPLTLYIHLH